LLHARVLIIHEIKINGTCRNIHEILLTQIATT